MTQIQNGQTNANNNIYVWRLNRVLDTRRQDDVNQQLLRRMHLN